MLFNAFTNDPKTWLQRVVFYLRHHWHWRFTTWVISSPCAHGCNCSNKWTKKFMWRKVFDRTYRPTIPPAMTPPA